MSEPSEKRLPVLSTALTLAALGGATALAVQFARRPLETFRGAVRAGMLLAGVREEIADVHGVRMHYYFAGRRGTPLVLIHGLGGSAENWGRLLPLLSKEFLVYAPDLPGFGKTPMAPDGVNIQTHALYLQYFLDMLGYPRAILVGNSLGGWIAARFALDHPERVEHLFLLNSAGLRREGMNSPYAVDRPAAQRSLNHIMGYQLPLPGFVLDAVVRQSQEPAYKSFIETYDPHEELDGELAQVKTPTTIIWGTADKIVPVTCANDFHTGIVGSQLFLLEGIGHSVQMQAPTKVARIILENALPKALRNL